MGINSIWIFFFITLFAYNFCITCCTYEYEPKCKINSYSQNCTDVIYSGFLTEKHRNMSITCKLCNVSKSDELMTVCSTNKYIMPEDILQIVNENVQFLHINADTIWSGDTPYQYNDLNLSGIFRLKNLSKFDLVSRTYPYVQFYNLIGVNVSRFVDLKNLKSLRLRFPFKNDGEKYFISKVIKHLPNLELLDLSYVRILGIDAFMDILKSLNNTNISELCMRKIQITKSINYNGNLGDILWNNSTLNLKFPFLEELDISDNAITKMSPGITKVLPKLRAIDISNNLLLDIRNTAWILELLLHPYLEVLNGNNQGCQSNENYVEIENGAVYKLPLSEKTNGISSTTKTFFQCMNHAGNGNISRIFANSGKTCLLLQCLFPGGFQDLTCSSTTFIPKLSVMFDYSCMLYMNIPIGKNIKSVKFSNVEIEQGGPIIAKLAGPFCLWKHNTLEQFEMNNNAWMRSYQIDETFSEISGTKNLNHLKELVFSNNYLSISLDSELTDILPSLEYLRLSGNFNNITNCCKAAPNINVLDLQNSNITDVHPHAINRCFKLRELYLGQNNLNINSLANLDLSSSSYLEYIGLNDTNLKELPKQFLQRIEKLRNLKMIDLSDNLLSCDCSEDSRYFVQWMKDKSSSLQNFEKYTCVGPHGISRVVDVNDTTTFWGVCSNKYINLAIISSASVVAIFLLLCILLVLYKFRWRLWYIFFKLQLKCYAMHTKSNNTKYIWRYDAFVSYSAEDRFWVHDTFMKMLEGTYGFRLCIHYRDFPVGGDIAETISERMSESRELIIILSDIAIKSEWCQFELNEALLHAYRRNKTLLVIKLGKIKNNLLNNTVAHLLDNHTFLEWSDNSKNKNRNKLFWKKLVAQLYNNPNGNINCCCTFGANSLGYKDFINPTEGDSIIYEDVGEVPMGLSAEAQKCRDRARFLKKKVNQAKNFKKTLENDLDDLEELPHWAYGPIPWPIEELLKEDKHKFEDLTYKHANERIKLLINCLEKKHFALNEIYQREIEMFEDMIQ